jgi:TRAP-type transport system small permease protein
VQAGEALMERVVAGYFHLLKIIIVACLAIMVILVFGNVVLRYAFNMGITLSEELSRFLFVWLTFLGAIVAFHERGHLGVDMVVGRLSPAGKKACLIVSQLLMLYVTWLFLEGSWQQTLINLDVKSPSAGMSMGLFYGVGIIFSLSVGVILIHDLYRVLTGRMRDDELVMVKESEEQEAFEELQAQLAARDAAARPIQNPQPNQGR